MDSKIKKGSSSGEEAKGLISYNETMLIKMIMLDEGSSTKS